MTRVVTNPELVHRPWIGKKPERRWFVNNWARPPLAPVAVFYSPILKSGFRIHQVRFRVHSSAYSLSGDVWIRVCIGSIKARSWNQLDTLDRVITFGGGGFGDFWANFSVDDDEIFDVERVYTGSNKRILMGFSVVTVANVAMRCGVLYSEP